MLSVCGGSRSGHAARLPQAIRALRFTAMQWSATLLLLSLAAALSMPSTAAQKQKQKQTICTITVNSDDEKETFRRHLPASNYQFVELVERGQPDWLASSCRSSVACDVLIVSAHFDGGNDFFSDRLETSEYLTVSELERVSCNDSCPTLFSRLKEVYLFGCNTLNPAPQSSASIEIVRSLVREGRSPQDAKRQLQSLTAAHGESSRDRMRQIFKGVPVIYGFSSAAPLGPVAGSVLSRYLRAGGNREIAQGRPSSSLLGHFAPFSMASTQGMTENDPHAKARYDMCWFADDRSSEAAKLEFVHGLLRRPTAEARLYLDRIQRLTSSLGDQARRTPSVAQAFEDIARDVPARTRFLEDARKAEQPTTRLRLINVARDLGWLSEDDRWQELALMLGELEARGTVGVPEVNLACSLNETHDLDGAFNRRVVPGSSADDVPHAAMRACLGSSEGHARTLQGLLSPNAEDVQIAQAYLRSRPITDTSELRRVTSGIAGMPASEAQVRALEALGRHYVSDHEVLNILMRLFAQTPSWSVQNAIAGILIRADRRSIPRVQLASALRENRRPSPAGEDMIDALVNNLRGP